MHLESLKSGAGQTKAWSPKPWLLAAALAGAKFALREERPEHVHWALQVPVRLLEVVTGQGFGWVEHRGYLSQDGRILVDHSCAGTGFFLMAVAVVLWNASWPKERSGVIALATGLAGLIPLTLAATSVRLVVTVGLARRWELGGSHLAWVHAVAGAMVYLLCLAGVQVWCLRILVPLLHPSPRHRASSLERSCPSGAHP